jgi:hypothetical protein
MVGLLWVPCRQLLGNPLDCGRSHAMESSNLVEAKVTLLERLNDRSVLIWRRKRRRSWAPHFFRIFRDLDNASLERRNRDVA